MTTRLGGPRVAYHTFGCKANQYDTERMRQELEARGAHTVAGWLDADLCVVNTCTVTNRADAEARRFIRRLRRENPELGIVVAGCSAALRAPEYRGMEGVRAVVEGHDPVRVAGAVAGATPPVAQLPQGSQVSQGPQVSLVQLGIRRSLDRIDYEPVGGELLTRREGATRGWLKVQDGCDRKCSFCATRLARGDSRSRPLDEVVAEARMLAEVHPELVITGIHIGHYGRDLRTPLTLADLLAALVREVAGVRFRLGSIEATEVDDALLDLLAGSGAEGAEGAEGAPGTPVATHLHMPLQSGADPVLRRMQRWHTRETYRRRALQIAERVPHLGLGADVITGFPGETAEDHAQTRTLIEELPFTYLHVFPFSPREGTLATDLPNPVTQRVAGERARELRELGQEKGRAYRTARLGTEVTVVVEGNGGTGLTEDYLRVAVRGAPAGSGSLVTGTLRGDADDPYVEVSHH